MKRFFFNFFYFSSRVFTKLSRLSLSSARKLDTIDGQRHSVIRSTRYDMVVAPDEPYYAEQYWTVMLPLLDTLPKDAKALDLGCSQGRLTIRLGKLFTQGHVVGCDISAEAITQARAYGAGESAGNIDFQVQPISDCLKTFSEQSVDVIIMTEVTFFYPQWKQDVPRIIQTLKPGGILVMSFRTQYFDALCLVQSRLWEDVEPVLEDRQGAIFGSTTVFSWQTSEEIRAFMVEVHGLELLELRGIGVCSGIPGDPHEHICQPSQLDDRERVKLMKLELELGKTVPDGGRYILAIARKVEI